MNRIAIVHMGAIGDLVQTLPTLRGVRARWPEAHVTLIGRPERVLLARMAGLADTCLDYDTSPVPADADLIIDFLGAPLTGGMPRGAILVTVAPLPPADCPEPAAEWIFQQAAARLDLPAVPLVPEIPVPESVIKRAQAVVQAGGICQEEFAAIHPGSGSLKKNWPIERFVRIARRLKAAGRQVVWLSGPAERDRGTLRAAAVRTGSILSELPMDFLAGVLAQAEIYLGNDSGITQIAAAVRLAGNNPLTRPSATLSHLEEREQNGCTPTVALFGPSNAAGWAPRGRHVRIVRSACGEMEGIAVDEVWAAMASLLA